MQENRRYNRNISITSVVILVRKCAHFFVPSWCVSKRWLWNRIVICHLQVKNSSSMMQLVFRGRQFNCTQDSRVQTLCCCIVLLPILTESAVLKTLTGLKYTTDYIVHRRYIHALKPNQYVGIERSVYGKRWTVVNKWANSLSFHPCTWN